MFACLASLWTEKIHSEMGKGKHQDSDAEEDFQRLQMRENTPPSGIIRVKVEGQYKNRYEFNATVSFPKGMAVAIRENMDLHRDSFQGKPDPHVDRSITDVVIWIHKDEVPRLRAYVARLNYR